MAVVLVVAVLAAAAAFRLGVAVWRHRLAAGHVVIGFFHPYCNGGGGGERVLWRGIAELHRHYAQQRRAQPLKIVVYSGDAVSGRELERAQATFNVAIDAPVTFVHIRSRGWLEAARFPRFTMLGQSLASVFVAAECLLRWPVHAFVDTTGYAFTYPLARLAFGCRVGCYTHYPTISTDMLARVVEKRPSYNNADAVARSATASFVKVLYYRLFAAAYGFVGRFAHVVMVNSSWTRNHIAALWRGVEARVVFPPCDTRALCATPLHAARERGEPGVAWCAAAGRQRIVLSVGQFRPEKDHFLQLESFARFVRAAPAAAAGVRLVVVGGCRNADDEKLVRALQGRARELGIADAVELRTNVPYGELLRLLSVALVGVHTMWNEHFGIGVVEFMAAGVVALAHNSGGPREDIVVPLAGKPTGFLAATPDEYADVLRRVFEEAAAGESFDALRTRARERAQEFSDEAFAAGFCASLLPLLA